MFLQKAWQTRPRIVFLKHHHTPSLYLSWPPLKNQLYEFCSAWRLCWTRALISMSQVICLISWMIGLWVKSIGSSWTIFCLHQHMVLFWFLLIVDGLSYFGSNNSWTIFAVTFFRRRRRHQDLPAGVTSAACCEAMRSWRTKFWCRKMWFFSEHVFLIMFCVLTSNDSFLLIYHFIWVLFILT